MATKQGAIRRALCLLFCVCLSTPLLAQAIVVSPASLTDSQKEQLLGSHSFYVNGTQTHGLSNDDAKTMYRLGPMSRTLVALTTLRMHAAGILDIDEPIAPTKNAGVSRAAINARSSTRGS